MPERDEQLHSDLRDPSRSVGDAIVTQSVEQVAVEHQLQALRQPLLHACSECHDGSRPSLVIVIAEGIAGPAPTPEEVAGEPNPVLRELRAASRPVVVTDSSSMWQLAWERIFTFMVMDELFGHPDKGEFVGRVVARAIESPFLEYCKHNLFVFDTQNAVHTRIRCIDQFVDVLSDRGPVVTRLC